MKAFKKLFLISLFLNILLNVFIEDLVFPINKTPLVG